MAVDYLHRLVVTGPHRNVREFRRGMYRKYPRTVAGKTWTEFVPFSFVGLYELAPAARRVEAEIPEDPYELSVWPIRRLDDRRSEVRYQFQTRNPEMPGLVRPLSRAFSSLTFTLLTLGLDDSSVESYSFRRGKVRKWFIPQDRQDFHWERARKKFGLVDDEVYDDDSAEHWVEEAMLDEALRHWNGSRTSAHRTIQMVESATAARFGHRARVGDLRGHRRHAGGTRSQEAARTNTVGAQEAAPPSEVPMRRATSVVTVAFDNESGGHDAHRVGPRPH